MRKVVRKLVPQDVRRSVRLAQRWWSDRQAGHLSRFARPAVVQASFPGRIEIQQPVFTTSTVANKLHNIRLAAARIERVTIEPAQLFSFWRAVGRPDAGQGYRKGRNLIAGELREDYGGGLCQLAGLVYHAALTGGLAVVERHHHSVDIYRDHERYTPLGADATVVYGYRDLRLENDTSAPVAFRFQISDQKVSCELCSPAPLPTQPVRFRQLTAGAHKEVVTERWEKGRWMSLERSVYRALYGPP